MPKVKPLTAAGKREEAFKARELAIQMWIDTGMVQLRERNKRRLAARAGIAGSTFTAKYQKPRRFTEEDIWKIEQVIGPLERKEGLPR